MKTSFLFLSLLLHSVLFAQSEPPFQPYGQLDTLKFYSVSLSATTSNGRQVYSVNGKETDAATYQKYKVVWDNITQCKPCYLKTYDINEQLLNEGERYQDCQVGHWIEFYPSGAIKLIGEFKINDTGNWKNAWDRGYCSRKDGEWKYFDEAGNLIRTEVWEDGKLIEN